MFSRIRGTVLITTMMSVSLVFMMIYALVRTSGFGLHGSASFYEREAALQAAQSGADYAVTRIQQNRFWRGDGNCAYFNDSGSDKPSLTIGSLDKGLIVEESNGNVVGLLKDRAGNKSAFRIKFNYESTADDVLSKIPRNIFLNTDGTTHSSPSLGIAMPYVSLNNLSNDKAELLYRANNNGKGLADKTENLELTDENAVQRAFAQHVPPQRFHIIVEGMAGKGLRDCATPKQVNDCANVEFGDSVAAKNIDARVVKRYVETSYALNHRIFKGNAAYANLDINLNVAQKAYIKSTGYQSSAGNEDDKCTVPIPGQLRSNIGNISVDCGDAPGKGILNTFNGKLYISQDKRADFQKDDAPYVFKNSKGDDEEYYFKENSIEETNKSVESIEWKQIAQAKNTDSSKMQAGFYRWDIAEGGTEEAPFYELRYYPDGFVGEQGTVPKPKKPSVYRKVVTDPKAAENDASVILMGPAGKVVFETDDAGHILKPTLSLKGQLYCGGDLLICSNTDKVVKHVPAVFLGPYNNSSGSGSGADNVESAVLTGSSNITLLTPVKGEGAVVTNGGDVNLVGESVLDSGEGGVAVYGNNVTVNSLELAAKKTPDNKDLCAESPVVTGKAKDYTPTSAICGQLYPYRDNGTEVINRAVEYFAKNHNVNITVTNYYFNNCSHYIALYFKHDCPSETNEYEVRVYSGKIEIGKVLEPTRQNIDYDIPCFTAPGDAVIGLKPGEEGGQSALDTCAQMFDSVCYGDTVISGIVYAKQNFRVNLGPRYKLVVNGAVRAEQGSINAACSYAYLTYDEQCLDKLMPKYCSLTAVMWNCW